MKAFSSLFKRVIEKVKTIFAKIYRVLHFVFIKSQKDSLFSHSSAISFYVLLYFIPFSMLIISISAFLLNFEEKSIKLLITNLQKFVPFLEFKPFLLEVQKIAASRSFMGIFGIIFLIYLSSKMFIIIQKSIHVAFGTHYKRGFFKDYILSFIFVFLFSLLYFLFSALEPVFHVLPKYLGEMGLKWEWLKFFTSYLVLILNYLLAVVFLFCLYYFVPNKIYKPKFAIIGAFLTTCIWLAGRYIFGIYIGYAANYSAFYGAYSIIVLFLLWIYFTATMLVFGAEITSMLVFYSRLRKRKEIKKK